MFPCYGEIVHPCSSNLVAGKHRRKLALGPTTSPFATLVQLVKAEEGNVREERTGVEKLRNDAYFYSRSAMNCDRLTLFQTAALATGDRGQDGVRIAYSDWREQTFLS